MEDVIWLEPTRDGVLLRSLFQDSAEVRGQIEGIDLLGHRILIASNTRQIYAWCISPHLHTKECTKIGKKSLTTSRVSGTI